MSVGIRRLFAAISVLSVIGIIVSAISLHHHYGTSATSFCTFGENFNCDMVNRSIYSSILGIPVALIGVTGYMVLLLLATLYKSRANARLMLLTASLAGLGFALYLTYVEAFVLAVWCVLCLSSLAVISIVTVLSLLLVKYGAEPTSEKCSG